MFHNGIKNVCDELTWSVRADISNIVRRAANALRWNTLEKQLKTSHWLVTLIMLHTDLLKPFDEDGPFDKVVQTYKNQAHINFTQFLQSVADVPEFVHALNNVQAAVMSTLQSWDATKIRKFIANLIQIRLTAYVDSIHTSFVTPRVPRSKGYQQRMVDAVASTVKNVAVTHHLVTAMGNLTYAEDAKKVIAVINDTIFRNSSALEQAFTSQSRQPSADRVKLADNVEQLGSELLGLL